MTPHLLILGAGRHQLPLLHQAKERGFRTVIADNLRDAPGRAIADISTLCDLRDVAACVDLGRRHRIVAVATSGSDAAVVTLAEVADRLGLPCYITPQGARVATNKLEMKQALRAAGVPMAEYHVVRRGGPAPAMADLAPAVVVKPVDSQGQRGTSLARTEAELESAVQLALHHSPSGAAVAEAFVDGCEVTANAWLEDGTPALLVVNDRVTYNPYPALGIAFQHVYPSVHAAAHAEAVREMMIRIAKVYGMREGPLYVQMIVGEAGLCVMEAAARVGGGHENGLLPLVSGVDVTSRLLDIQIGTRSAPIAQNIDTVASRRHALVNFLLAHAGHIASCHGMEGDERMEGLSEGAFYVQPGNKAMGMINSLGRVGYFIAHAGTRPELMRLARTHYDSLSLRDPDGRELLFWPEPERLIGA